MEEIHQNDIGTEFRILVKDNDTIVDLSSATGTTIFIEKPDSTIIEEFGDFVTDGTDGLINYITVDGDLDQVGTYKIQGKIEIDGGVFYTSLGSFKVHHNLG